MQGNKHQCYVNFDYVRYRGNGKGDVFTLISCSFLHITFAHSVSTGVFFPRFEMHSGLATAFSRSSTRGCVCVCLVYACMGTWLCGYTCTFAHTCASTCGFVCTCVCFARTVVYVHECPHAWKHACISLYLHACAGSCTHVRGCPCSEGAELPRAALQCPPFCDNRPERHEFKSRGYALNA